MSQVECCLFRTINSKETVEEVVAIDPTSSVCWDGAMRGEEVVVVMMVAESGKEKGEVEARVRLEFQSIGNWQSMMMIKPCSKRLERMNLRPRSSQL